MLCIAMKKYVNRYLDQLSVPLNSAQLSHGPFLVVIHSATQEETKMNNMIESVDPCVNLP